ncbi:MAG: S8 family serine peptidase [Caldisericia bacterium]|nr:S8 family serine peptidase [Caldisericia bacterium]
MKRYACLIAAFVLVFGSLWITGFRPVEPKRDFYMVELTDYTGSNQIASMLLENQHETFKTNLLNRFPSVGINAEYRTLLSGFSLDLTPQEAKDLSMMDGVVSVVKGRIFYPHMFNTVVSTKAKDVWNMKDKLGKNIQGEGVLVGIIDTGIDYDHPSLGNGFKNTDSKVVAGYDFSDLDDDPLPVAGHQGWHGTHCAGIVAATGLPGIARDDVTITGMAPAAKLGAYKVFGGVGGARTDRIMQAMERAWADGCKVISMSLGSTYVWQDEIYCRAIDKLTDKGVVCSVSAGNDGGGSREELPFQVGSPGGAEMAVCVAAMDDRPKPIISWDSNLELMNYIGGSVEIDKPIEATLVDALSGYEDDVKDLDLTGKIALVKRGDKYFSDKALQVQKKGAIACVIYNNEVGLFDGYLVDSVDIPVFAIDDKSGKLLVDYAKTSGKAKIETKEHTGAMADFSSAGPTNDYKLKPDVSAPGVGVLSSVGASSYIEMSGTSMACPAVSGLAALVIQAHPDWTAHDVRSAIINYADPQSDLKGKLWSIHSQGTGRVNSVNSVNAPVLFKPTSLNFGKVTGSTDFNVSLKNPTTKPVKFSVKIYSEDGVVTGDVAPVEVPAGKTIKYSGKLKVSSQEGLTHVGYVIFESTGVTARVGFLLLTTDPPTPPTIDRVQVMTPAFSPNGDRKLDRFVAQFSLNTLLDGFEWSILDEDDNLYAILDYSYGLQGGGFWFLTWDGKVDGTPLGAGKYKMIVNTLGRGKDPRKKSDWETWGPLEFYVVEDPPEITTEEIPPTIYNQTELAVKGTVEDWLADPDYMGAKGLVSLETLVNGEKGKFTLDGKGAFEINCKLKPGKNEIVISASNAGGMKAEKKISVNSLNKAYITIVDGKIRVNNQPFDFGKIKKVSGDFMIDMEKLHLICPDFSLNLLNDKIYIVINNMVARMKLGKDTVLSNTGESWFCEPPYMESNTCYVPLFSTLLALKGYFDENDGLNFVWKGNEN